MFDIGMSELLIVGVVALIVVGPKDLPGMFKTLGKFTARVRAMGREFSRAMENAADEAGMKEAGEALKAASNPKQYGLDAINDAAKDLSDWDLDNEGPEPPRPQMDESRAEMAKKISENAARMANERIAAEKAVDTAQAAEKPAKKPAAKKPAAKKTTAKKPAAKKPAPKKKTPANAKAKKDEASS